MSTTDQEKYQQFVTEFNEEYPESVDHNGNHPLNCEWVLWSHDWDKKGWQEKDYDSYGSIATVEEFWNVYNGLPSLLNKDMWFLMRKGIPPRWEDPININGGAFKFRVAGDNVDNSWLTISLFLVTENSCLDIDDANLICGIGLSPKQKNFSTVSVWNLDSSHTAHAQFPKNIDGINFNMSRYEPHNGRKFG